VYLLLSQHELQNYYCLNDQPGNTVKDVSPEKFRFLDEKSMQEQLLYFNNGKQASVTFHLPQMHCSSCLWLLEHLERIDPAIQSSRVDFAAKELYIVFEIPHLPLSRLAALLTAMGYEPHINREKPGDRAAANTSRATAYKIGITGFCFANIMLISFPEYLGLQTSGNEQLVAFFRWVNLLLALPVFFYGAGEFFKNAWLSFRQKYLNIDAPIALAIAVTFFRSVYEIITGTGAGYLDSMSGIVFFMLIGRALQNRTYRSLNFSRDYKSYFPVAMTVVRDGLEMVIPIREIRAKDVLRLRHQEVIPADSILSKGNALIDYSFITGESTPEQLHTGNLVYAGGKVAGNAIELVAIKDFSQNSFTRLWNHKAFRKDKSKRETSTAVIARYFSLVVLLIAAAAFLYWQLKNPANAWNALTAVLIVACPCSLLLTTTFTNGYLLEHFAAQGLFMKDATTIEQMATCDHITFDKTGTITEASQSPVKVMRMQFSPCEKELALAVMAQSIHPLSRAIVVHFRYKADRFEGSLKELPGKGLEAWINDRHIKIGSREFVTGNAGESTTPYSEVWVSIDKQVKAHFLFDNRIKSGIHSLIPGLSGNYGLSLVSGDNENSKKQLKQLFPEGTALLYRQSPEQKLQHIQSLQQQNKKVMMIGDGLNDAGALQQSDIGIAIVDHSFSFSPACDILLEAGKLPQLPYFLRQAKAAQKLILAGFIYSLLFNIAGLSFAVTAHLSPLVAAILMPSSSLGIMLIAYLGVRIVTRSKMTAVTDPVSKG
jgi:Cu+-exporting ATPase